MKTIETHVIDGKVYETVTTQEIINYLESKLGFSFLSDFTRWVGIDPYHSYVRMRVAFNPKDVMESKQSPSMTALPFKQEFMDKIRPYMYSKESFDYIESHPEEMYRLNNMGIFRDRLYDLKRGSELKYHKATDIIGVYLKPEKIIYDIKGWRDLTIFGVEGTTSDTIIFRVTNFENKDGKFTWGA